MNDVAYLDKFMSTIAGNFSIFAGSRTDSTALSSYQLTWTRIMMRYYTGYFERVERIINKSAFKLNWRWMIDTPNQE